jgi:hypothetical protein
MAILLAFLLGIANFALHRAVLESGHPLLDRATWAIGRPGGRFSLALEFAALLAAMLAIANGATGWAWAYAAYSLTNAISAWLILTGRI